MDGASLFYLGITFGLFALFVVIVVRTCNRRRREELEKPKHRMLDDD